MEFNSRTFKKSKTQTRDNDYWVYTLIGIIFFLVAYLLNDFGLTGWPIVITVFAGLAMIYWARYYTTFRKENIDGDFEKEISLTEEGIRISNLFIPFDKISTIDIEIDKYEGELKAEGLSRRTFYKSAGISNRLIINTDERAYSETFHLRDKKHYHNLLLVVRELRKTGVKIELNNQS